MESLVKEPILRLQLVFSFFQLNKCHVAANNHKCVNHNLREWEKPAGLSRLPTT